eukprot:gene4708-21002_t
MLRNSRVDNIGNFLYRRLALNYATSKGSRPGPYITGLSFSTKKAWTVVPVCYQEYTYHGLFQVGIFHDAPSNAIIDQIQNEPLAQTITNLRRKKIIKLVDGASIFIRIGDTRRREELEDPSKLTVRKTFLPRGNKYLNVAQSKRFATIIPPDQNAEEYGKVLASKFRMKIVYVANHLESGIKDALKNTELECMV